MRRLAKGRTSGEAQIVEHVILKNWWEYYLCEPDENGVAFGFVMGHENEWGYVDLKEIEPYVMMRTKDLYEVMPPAGYMWEDGE